MKAVQLRRWVRLQGCSRLCEVLFHPHWEEDAVERRLPLGALGYGKTVRLERSQQLKWWLFQKTRDPTPHGSSNSSIRIWRPLLASATDVVSRHRWRRNNHTH